MKLTIFGASGKTGQHLVQQALDAGHEVTALVRTPAKLTLKHDCLHVLPGDIQNPEQVEKAIAGSDAVISVLGPSSNTPDYIVSKGMGHILAAMQKRDVRRLVISAGAGVPDPHDKPNLMNHAISLLLKLLSRHVVEDMTRVVKQVRDSDRDWTIVRVPMLTDDAPSGNFRVGYVGDGTGVRLSRADMATFILRQVTDTTHLRKAPVVSN